MPEIRHHEQETLVEHVMNKIRVPPIRFSPMDEQERFEMLELRNYIICRLCSLGAFKALDAYADMGCKDHVDVVSSVSDGKSYLVGVFMADHFNYFGLLFGGGSAGDDDFHF